MRLFSPFRWAVIVLLVLLGFRVTITRPDRSIGDNWAVLVDSSLSMRVKDPVARIDVARNLAENIVKKIPNSHLYSFSDKPAQIDLVALKKLEPTGPSTSIGSALSSTFEQGVIRGAVILTDGRDSRRGDAVSVAATMGKPLFLVGLGDSTLFKDVAIRRVQGPPFAFKNTPVKILATISANGFSGKSLSVSLREKDRVLSVQTIVCRQMEHESEIEFSWTPSTLGSKRLVVEASAQSGETSVNNNRKSFALDVGRDRFRVLYISGDPGPEYGFLRHQFKSDPGVELVTFVILRNNMNTLTVPDAELSLIPFPTEEVFIQQMASFDLVVFDEFPFRRFGLSPGLIQAIARRVEHGGSFLLVASSALFVPGSDYMGSGAEEFLPVEFGQRDIRTSQEPLSFVPNGTQHPIFKVDKNSERNAQIWKNAPPLEEAVLGLRPKNGASILGTVHSQGQDHPVLVAWKKKQGRVAVLGARTTFRWAMMSKGEEYDARLYSQFWKNMVLWLTHSSDDKTVRLGLEEKEWEYKTPATIRVWVYDSYFKPLSDALVQLQVTWADKTTDFFSPSLETEGVYSVTTDGKIKGPVVLKAFVQRSNQPYGQDSLNAVVSESNIEESDLRPDFETLKEMARVSNGVYVPSAQFSVDQLREFQSESERKFGRKIALWKSPWIMALLLLLLLTEWAWRRWKGQP